MLVTVSKNIRLFSRSLLLVMIGCFAVANINAAVYLSPQDFIKSSLGLNAKPSMLWLKGETLKTAKKILGHQYRGLRVRYWRQEGKTAWILDEIGKDKPITIGIIIAADQIQSVQILNYREPRGGEVRHPFFTRQYEGLQLGPDMNLNGQIDGISGATLSVHAVTNVSRFALYLNQLVD